MSNFINLKDATQKNVYDLLNHLEIKTTQPSLYITALTHKSYRYEHSLNYDYENLEFLGDAVLTKIIVEKLYKENKQNKTVHELNDEKVLMIQSKTLAKAAKRIGLDQYVLVGNGFVKNDSLDKVLEDTFEAIIGAIYIDQGEIACKKIVEQAIIYMYEHDDLNEYKDYKTLIQQELIKDSHNTIKYVTTKKTHDLTEVTLKSDSIVYGVGRAKNRKDAEKQAAKDAYLKLSNCNHKNKRK